MILQLILQCKILINLSLEKYICLIFNFYLKRLGSNALYLILDQFRRILVTLG